MNAKKDKNEKDMTENDKSNDLLIEGVDFEWSKDGLMILSREYLLKRGYCCENDCFNCPYN
ncbi:MAG: DUF5522 domain-containing protein [Oligoflexales bacterium]